MATNSLIPFDSLPERITELCNILYPDTPLAASILQLDSCELSTNALSAELHSEETRQLATYTFGKRRREWLAGRLCGKHALDVFLTGTADTLLPLVFSDVHIVSEESGQPCFRKTDISTTLFPRLSITHSRDYAAALVSSVHCGIDIQFSAENILRVTDHFCSFEEDERLLAAFPKFTIRQRLTLLWTGKEALKKMLSHQGMPGFRALTLREIHTKSQKTCTLLFCKSDQKTVLFPVAATLFTDDYAIAITCLKTP